MVVLTKNSSWIFWMVHVGSSIVVLGASLSSFGLLLPNVLVSAAAAEESVIDPHLDESKAIFDWVQASEKGYVTKKQEVRRLVPGDANSPLIVVAKERIEHGEKILRLPWQFIIESDDPEDGGQLPCGTVRNLAREMRLGKDSKYAPYINYLNSERGDQIPSGWSRPAKNLLLDVVGRGDDRIPPKRPTDWIKRWIKRCNGDPNDTISIKAALLVIQRSDDQYLLPAYDNYNHRNGNWTNTRTITVDGEYQETVATKTIEPGDEIFISYNLCAECGGRKRSYGTAGK